MPEWTPVPLSEPSSGNPGGDIEYLTTKKQRSWISRSRTIALVDRLVDRLRGWRTGIAVCIVLSTLVLILNLIITIISDLNPQKGHEDNLFTGDSLSTFYEGNCSTSKSLSVITHLILNILATVLLSASNYCTQILVSPTRNEIDKAHSKNRWLRIGVPNFQNLAYLHWFRSVLCVLLVVSSLPLHLLWNSAIVQTISSNDYFIGGVTEDFATGSNAFLGEEQVIGGWFQGSRSDFDEIWLPAVRSPQVANLTTRQCIEAFGKPLVEAYGNVAVVFDTQNSTNALLFAGTHITGADQDDPSTTGVGDHWVCGLPSPKSPSCQTGDTADDNSTYWTPLSRAAQWPTLASSNPYLNGIASSNVSVKYCLAEVRESSCRIATAPTILYVVVAANAVKLFCFLCTWIIVHHKATYEGEERIVTNGDMIASYLRMPDSRFSGRCLASSRLVRHSNRSKYHGLGDVQFWDASRPMPLQWETGSSEQHDEQNPSSAMIQEGKQRNSWCCGSRSSKRAKVGPRWYTGASRMTWLVWIIPSAFAIVALFGVYFGFRLQRNLFLGFGQPSAQSTVSMGPGTGPGRNIGILASTLLANVPQIAVTYLYVACNSVLTSMLAHHEVSQLAICKRGLRVSFPRWKTEQRGTYYLQLPSKIAVPLMISSTVLHWFMSQSLFILRVAIYRPDGVQDVSRLISTVGYSSSPILGVLALLAVFVGGILVLGWVKRYDGAEKMPLVATCSASLAAATCPSTYLSSDGMQQEFFDDKKDSTAYRSPPYGRAESFEEGLAEERIQWGVVDEGNGDKVTQHATFSRNPLCGLKKGQLYA
ncbi:hypothetical protein F5Y15DRAFT_129872 [Xylariaceae sp. FL0016]|nr:hypothetical protein F5Y15DRAFT_129872 [Xylariaceae sp. FL0016]